MSTTYTYSSRLTAKQARQAVQDVLSTDGPIPSEFAIKQGEIEEGIKFRESGSGIDSDSIALIVSIATPILTRIWDQWLLPRIRERRGDDSIDEQQRPDAGTS